MEKTPSPVGRSSHRARPADETLRIAEGWFAALGISRVTNITRLDWLAIPVFASIRPRGLTLRVHAGKGLDAASAKVGAAMEAVEFALAEPQVGAWTRIDVTADALSAQLGPGTTLVHLRPRLGVSVQPEDIIPAVTCRDLIRGTDVRVPAELVFFPFDPAPLPQVFGGTTNGIASGNTLEEATLHALLEVLERDAIAMNAPSSRSLRVNPSSYPSPFAAMATAWAERGVELVVRAVPNVCGLPCFEARLHDPGSDDITIATGQGLHPDRAIAFTRAVCEAAQSRLTAIHGGRDDLVRAYAKFDARLDDRLKVEQAEVTAFADPSAGIDFGDVPSVAADEPTIAGTLDQIQRILLDSGFRSIYRYRFETPSTDLHVVRVVVPGCEQIDHGVRRMGPRLLARVLGRE